MLGMSSDSIAAGLVPDYLVPWETLFQRVIKFVLHKDISVKTWGNREIAIIKSKGCILGRISSVERDNARYDRQHVDVVLNEAPIPLEYKDRPSNHSPRRRYYDDPNRAAHFSNSISEADSEHKSEDHSTRWTLHVAAKYIQSGDFICLLRGVSKPIIIRTCKDHFAIILIAVNILQRSGDSKHQEHLACKGGFSTDILLARNWENPPINLQDQAGFDTSSEINTLVPDCVNHLERASSLGDMILVLGDLGYYREADKRVQEILRGFGDTFDKGNFQALTSALDRLALIYKTKKQWKRAEGLFLQIIQLRKLVQGTSHKNTLSTIANLASTYMDHRNPSYGTMQLRTSLTDRIRNNAIVTGKQMAEAVCLFGKRTTTLLLYLEQENVQITEEVLLEIAKSSDGSEMKLLLLDQRGTEIKITEKVLNAAAKKGNTKLVSLLLKWCGTDVSITEEIVVNVIASGNTDLMQLLLGMDVKIIEEVAKAAAGNPNGKIIQLLLDQRGTEFRITEEIVKAAAGNWKAGIMQLLLDRRGTEFNITEKVVKAAAENWNGDIIQLLLDQRGAEVQITEELIKVAVSYPSLYTNRPRHRYRPSHKKVRVLCEAIGMKVTPGVIEAAATSGNEGVLYLFDD